MSIKITIESSAGNVNGGSGEVIIDLELGVSMLFSHQVKALSLIAHRSNPVPLHIRWKQPASKKIMTKGNPNRIGVKSKTTPRTWKKQYRRVITQGQP